MRFTIVTPSFRNSRWLKLCIPSVADQDIEHEHIVQDACSDDGTQEWLARDPRVIPVIEKDAGMYDAVNRGFRRGRGELLAYLNCDEQYLPGALRKVSEFFDQHPQVDVVLGDSVVVDKTGGYLSERRSLVPQTLHCHVGGTLSFLTSGLFMRRRVIDEHQLFFDPTLRIVGDCDWSVRGIKAGLRMAVLKDFTSTYTQTGQNMNLEANGTRGEAGILPAGTGLGAKARAAHRGPFPSAPLAGRLLPLPAIRVRHLYRGEPGPAQNFQGGQAHLSLEARPL